MSKTKSELVSEMPMCTRHVALRARSLMDRAQTVLTLLLSALEVREDV